MTRACLPLSSRSVAEARDCLRIDPLCEFGGTVAMTSPPARRSYPQGQRRSLPALRRRGLAANFVEDGTTTLRATLIFVQENQNITLSVPRSLLKRVKRLAADRDTSVSALMTEALSRLADEDRRYSAARRRALTAMKSARSLGTRGRRAWSRDELHDR